MKIEVEFLVVDVLAGGSEGCGQGDEHAVQTQGSPHRGHEPPGRHRDASVVSTAVPSRVTCLSTGSPEAARRDQLLYNTSHPVLRRRGSAFIVAVSLEEENKLLPSNCFR